MYVAYMRGQTLVYPFPFMRLLSYCSVVVMMQCKTARVGGISVYTSLLSRVRSSIVPLLIVCNQLLVANQRNTSYISYNGHCTKPLCNADENNAFAAQILAWQTPSRHVEYPSRSLGEGRCPSHSSCSRFPFFVISDFKDTSPPPR